ncbi:MAG: molecular chaperone DjiA [Albidovulum sp.]|nr:molecular chaperone DjiA [Albidovulum sp.]
MELWTKVSEIIARLTRRGEKLGAIFNSRSPPERSVAFTIAVIALGAKLAKADGRVTRDEVRVFRALFKIPAHAEKNAARLFDLAREDMAGYEFYARRIATMFRKDKVILGRLMEALFQIAVADGGYDPAEDAFLRRVSEIFGLSDSSFRKIRSRFAQAPDFDPYAILGVDRKDSLESIKKKWRKLVLANHPDKFVGSGLPEEARRMAELRLESINKAHDLIKGSAVR